MGPTAFLACRVVAVLLVALLTPAAGVRASDGSLEIAEVRTDSFPRVVVRLNASLADALPAANLAPENLRVVEDGEAQPSAALVQIRGSATPASVVLMLDVSGSMAEQGKLPQAREAARGFLAQLRPSDQAAILSFGDDVVVRQPFTADRRLLGRALDSLTAGGNTRLYDALGRGVSQLGAAPSGSRAIVLLTDGEDTGSAASLEGAIASASGAGAPVYTIGLGARAEIDVLQRIASETGGRFYQAPAAQDLAEAFRLVTRQISSQYELFWLSRVQPLPGREVPVQIRLSAQDGSVAQASFTYRLPAYSRARAAAPVAASINAGRPLAIIPAAAPPPESEMLLAGLLAGLTVALLYAGFVLPRFRRHLHLRLAAYLGGQAAPSARSGAEPSLRPLQLRHGHVSLLTALAARLSARLLPRRQLERVRRYLAQAGLQTERHLRLFLAARLALAVLLGALGYVLVLARAPERALLLGLLLAALGFYLPGIWLKRRIRARQGALLRALPDALDLMCVGVSAGLSLDSVMIEVVQRWDSELSREFNQVLTELRLGTSRRQALLNLVERTQLDDLRLLVAVLIQADELGTSLTETLTVQAAQLRIRRRQLAEELARKAPVKMLFPMVFMIFPALFVVLLGPAGLQFISAIRSMAHGR